MRPPWDRRQFHGAVCPAVRSCRDGFVIRVESLESTTDSSGLLGIVANASAFGGFSTLSHLGYLTVRVAFRGLRAGIFPPHDARVFQGAAVSWRSSVIIAMHHEQDMRRWCFEKVTCHHLRDCLVGMLERRVPGTSGVFSKILDRARGRLAPVGRGTRTFALSWRLHHRAVPFRMVRMTFPRQGSQWPITPEHFAESPGWYGAPHACWRFLGAHRLVHGQVLLFGNFFEGAFMVFRAGDTADAFAKNFSVRVHSSGLQWAAAGMVAAGVLHRIPVLFMETALGLCG